MEDQPDISISPAGNDDMVIDDDEETQDESDVQLGFIEDTASNVLFQDNDWRNWDGGTVGGRPVSLYFMYLTNKCITYMFCMCFICTSFCWTQFPSMCLGMAEPCRVA